MLAWTQLSTSAFSALEISTNLIDWDYRTGLSLVFAPAIGAPSAVPLQIVVAHFILLNTRLLRWVLARTFLPTRTATTLVVTTNLIGIDFATPICVESRVIRPVGVPAAFFPSTLAFVAEVSALTNRRRIDGVALGVLEFAD
jgi:hypothetical protein